MVCDAEAFFLLEAAEPVDPEVVAETDQQGRKHHGQHVQVSHEKRGPAESPAEPRHQRNHLDEGAADTASKGDHKAEDAHERKPGGPIHVPQDGGHLVIVEGLPARYTRPHLGVSGLSLKDQRPQLLQGILRPGECSLLLLRDHRHNEETFLAFPEIALVFEVQLPPREEGGPR